MIVFEPASKLLLFLHLIAAACAAGTGVHLAIRVYSYLRGQVIKVRLEKLYARLLAISYTACYALGAAIYPTFRIRVRHDYFDPDLPWATALFEVKEHFATVGLAAAIGVLLLSRAVGRPWHAEQRRFLPLYGGLVMIVLATLAYSVWSGWYLSTLRSV